MELDTWQNTTAATDKCTVPASKFGKSGTTNQRVQFFPSWAMYSVWDSISLPPFSSAHWFDHRSYIDGSYRWCNHCKRDLIELRAHGLDDRLLSRDFFRRWWNVVSEIVRMISNFVRKNSADRGARWSRSLYGKILPIVVQEKRQHAVRKFWTSLREETSLLCKKRRGAAWR